MDDLKVVLYIVIAIIWVVYNNYKKISEASRKRDFTKPPAEVIQENWPGKSEKVVRPFTRKPEKAIERHSNKDVRKVLERRPLPQRKPIRKQSPVVHEERFIPPGYAIEGGTTTPSKVVHFEEQEQSLFDHNPLLTAIRNMDLKQGIVVAEILKRPYN